MSHIIITLIGSVIQFVIQQDGADRNDFVKTGVGARA
jgi:hypothetical protein